MVIKVMEITMEFVVSIGDSPMTMIPVPVLPWLCTLDAGSSIYVMRGFNETRVEPVLHQKHALSQSFLHYSNVFHHISNTVSLGRGG